MGKTVAAAFEAVDLMVWYVEEGEDRDW